MHARLNTLRPTAVVAVQSNPAHAWRGTVCFKRSPGPGLIMWDERRRAGAPRARLAAEDALVEHALLRGELHPDHHLLLLGQRLDVLLHASQEARAQRLLRRAAPLVAAVAGRWLCTQEACAAMQ